MKLKFFAIIFCFFVLLGCSPSAPDKNLTGQQVSEQYLSNILKGDDDKAFTYIVDAENIGMLEKSMIKNQLTQVYRAMKNRFGTGFDITLQETEKSGNTIIYNYLIKQGGYEIILMPVVVIRTNNGWRVIP